MAAAEATTEPGQATTGGYQFSADAPAFQPGNHAGLLRGGYFNEELGWWVPFYVGTLKSFNMRTGYGFLESEKTFQIFRNDIYIHKSQVPIPWKIGAFVEFAVSQNNKGQPQASDVYWLPLSPSLTQQEPQTSSPKAAGAGGSSGSKKTRFMGTLKSFSKMQGYGFINSEDVGASTNSLAVDVYLDRGQLQPEGRWTLGQTMEFDVSYNHRGQPQARNVNWDPVPKLPLAAAAAGVAALPGGSMNLMAMGAGRLEGQAALRNMSKIQTAMRSDAAGGNSVAVKLAIELAETAEDIDYISFVLDRLGPPETAIAELTGNIPALLVLSISKMLRKSVFPAERSSQNLAWMSVLLPLLSSAKTEDGSGEGFIKVLATVQENLEKAAATAPNQQDFDDVIAQLIRAAK